MSSKQQSDQSSTSSASSTQPPPRSLIVLKVSLDKDEATLYDCLSYDYSDVKKVSRNYDENGRELSSIRVDFKSTGIVAEILDENAIYIENKPYYIRPHWPRICYRCEEEGHIAAECPRQSLSERRLAGLLEEQKTNFETLINGFEKRWSERLSTLTTAPKTTNLEQLLPVVNDLNTVCNQLNQQNIQMQKQIGTIANRVQNIQTKANK